MPKVAKALSAVVVSQLKTNGRYMVGGNVVRLHLRVSGESRSWILRTVIEGKRCDIGLGSYPTIPLAKARELASEKHGAIKSGSNPLATKRKNADATRLEKARTKTFEQCAVAYVAAHKGDWRNEKHAKQWSATLEKYAFPLIGKLPVASIDTAHIQSVLEQPIGSDKVRLWEARAETASRLRGRIECVLDAAKAAGLRQGDNPARWDGHLKHLLGKRQRLTRGHHAALPYRQIGTFMVELRKREGIAARAVEFAILCASRSGEVRGATWSEVKLETGVWTIPATRMKAGKEHIVPLSDAALALLRSLPRIVGSDFIFPAPRGGELSDMSLTAVLKRMGYANFTMHGMRSGFKDWASDETDYSDEYPRKHLPTR